MDLPDMDTIGREIIEKLIVRIITLFYARMVQIIRRIRIKDWLRGVHAGMGGSYAVVSVAGRHIRYFGDKEFDAFLDASFEYLNNKSDSDSVRERKFAEAIYAI